MNKSFFTIFFVLFISFAFAQKTDNTPVVEPAVVNCKTADDSIMVRKHRGEVSFYLPAKFTKDQYFYYIIDKYKYKRKQMSESVVSKSFLSCYNKSIQKTLDSIYKVDFFRKSDSIITAYDKQGKGYRNTDFPGGVMALQMFLEKNIKLPASAKPSDADKNIRVYYSFFVDENGNISDYKLVKSNCNECESIVLEALKKMPKFIPATEAGAPKAVKYILPFTRTITKK